MDQCWNLKRILNLQVRQQLHPGNLTADPKKVTKPNRKPWLSGVNSLFNFGGVLTTLGPQNHEKWMFRPSNHGSQPLKKQVVFVFQVPLLFNTFQLKVNCWFGSRWFGFRLDPRKWKGLLLTGVPLESQTTNQNQTTKITTWEQQAHLSQNHQLTRWWQLKYLLFSPRTLGKIPILTSIFFNWVGSTTNSPLVELLIYHHYLHRTFPQKKVDEPPVVVALKRVSWSQTKGLLWLGRFEWKVSGFISRMFVCEKQSVGF